MTASTPLHSLFASWQADFLEQDDVQLPLRVSGAGEEYQAAVEGSVLADGGDRAWIRVEGAECAAWLQRFLSSDVLALEAGYGQWSAMLDAKGRWVSDLLLYRTPAAGSDAAQAPPQWFIDCPASRCEVLLQRLEMMHFGEDCAWQQEHPARLLIGGPAARACLHAVGIPHPAGAAAGPHQEMALDLWTASSSAPALTVLRRPDRGLDCWEVLGDPAAVEELARTLHNAGAVPTGIVVLDILRVEAGLPRWGSELSEEVSLPESNEWRRGSLSKGCYAGQEVLARIHTYGEAPRQLCQLRFDGGQVPLHGAELFGEDGRKLGLLHSWVHSPRAGCPLGLGTLRRRAATDGVRVWAVLGEEKVMATVRVPDKVVG